MKKVFVAKDEVVSFLKDQTSCSDITVNDKTVLLVDKEWALKKAEKFGVHKRKYLEDFDIFEKIAAIENSADFTEKQKAVKIEELNLTINHDCEDFADILKAEFIKINGWLAVGRVDGQKEKDGKISAHAFNFMITTEWELIYIEPQTNGTWTTETNEWIPYKIVK
ncbi:MAG: hypothetical protein LBU81_00785 [Methanosarcinales archaeon]|jgi:hypothetical protein|nr:hypothetical protein [Methanosarcinales archaeon]